MGKITPFMNFANNLGLEFLIFRMGYLSCALGIIISVNPNYYEKNVHDAEYPQPYFFEPFL